MWQKHIVVNPSWLFVNSCEAVLSSMVGIGLFLPWQETYVHIIVHIGPVDLHPKKKTSCNMEMWVLSIIQMLLSKVLRFWDGMGWCSYWCSECLQLQCWKWIMVAIRKGWKPSSNWQMKISKNWMSLNLDMNFFCQVLGTTHMPTTWTLQLSKREALKVWNFLVKLKRF